MSYIGRPKRGFNVMSYNQQKLDLIRKRILVLESTERQLIESNNNGSMDTALYNLRKELDTLRLKQRKQT